MKIWDKNQLPVELIVNYNTVLQKAKLMNLVSKKINSEAD